MHCIALQTGWMQNIALTLQVLLGALTTALGAALGGKKARSIQLAPHHNVTRLTSMPDVRGDLNPRRGVDTRGVVHGAHEGLERATTVAHPLSGPRSVPARGQCVCVGPR